MADSVRRQAIERIYELMLERRDTDFIPTSGFRFRDTASDRSDKAVEYCVDVDHAMINEARIRAERYFASHKSWRGNYV